VNSVDTSTSAFAIGSARARSSDIFQPAGESKPGAKSFAITYAYFALPRITKPGTGASATRFEVA